MLSNLSDTAILTKVRAMYGRRLTPQDYTELLHKQTVGEVAVYLKSQTHYQDVLSQMQESQIHRGQLEHLIRMEQFRCYRRILGFCKNGNSFYRYVIWYMEVQLIIERIGCFYTGISPDDVSDFPAELERYLSFSMIELHKAKNFREMLRVLGHTGYDKVLAPFDPGEGKPDLLQCEHALQVFQFQHLAQLIEQRFRGSVRKNLLSIYSTHIELLNVITIYRLKRFGCYPAEVIRGQLIPALAQSRLEQKLWDRMIEAQSVEEAMALLANSGYAKYLDGDYTFIEYTAKSIRYHLSKRFMTFATDAPTGFAAYMVLSQIEKENIINIIEGIRYGLEPEQIEKLLIL